MEKDYIYNVLLERGYNTYTARLVAEELLKLHKPLSEYLTYWLDNESHRKDFIINGYSIFQLQMERQMTYPAALLTMEWLINEPKIALKSLKRKIR